ncbi:MAG: hypothetical protein WC694_00835 [Candidatus Paceibacterota bacterium]|jgi:hypothetical protein
MSSLLLVMIKKEHHFLYISIALLILVVICIIGCVILIEKGNNKNYNHFGNNPVACTMEAKLCGDGSYVGRSGPNCDFTACPEITTPSNNGSQSILPYKSGVKGKVVLGPTCPVERNPPDPNCTDKPYKTTVVVFRSNDLVHPFVITTSDANGSFSASLPPGKYTLGAGESNLPRCDHLEITVNINIFTSATISCDTGIR